MEFPKNLNYSWQALRIGLGAAAFLAGLDKYFNLLADWSMYVSPLAERFLPVSGKTLMLVIGPVEMLVGLAILTRWTRIGAYAASVWLLAIALNLLTTGSFFDIAVRDVIMAIAAFTLANLTEARDAARNAPAFVPRLAAEPTRPAKAA
jgi:hypothetical protein